MSTKTFTPSPPQVLMREHLHAHPHALNFVGMGIGKTAACLSVLSELIKSGKSRGALIIAPLRVINLTWPMEVQGFEEFKWMRVANLRTDLGRRMFVKGAAHIYMINYESLPKLVAMLKHCNGKLPYDVEIWDECFAKGTMVDTPEGKKPIEQVKKGDDILNVTGKDTVTQTHENIVHRIAHITIGQKEIWCSADHMFFTTDGWIKAQDLQAGRSMVITTRQSVRVVRDTIPPEESLQREQDAVLQPQMHFASLREDTSGGECQKASPHQKVRRVWESFHGPVCRSSGTDEVLREILLREMAYETLPIGVDASNEEKELGAYDKVHGFRSPIGVSDHETHHRVVSDEEPRVSQEIERYAASDRSQASSTRGQWQTTTRGTHQTFEDTSKCGTGEMVCGTHHTYQRVETSEGEQVAHALQVGHRVSKQTAVDRGGWVYSQLERGTKEGQEEGGCDGTVRVESVEVLQSEDSRLDRFRSPDGIIRFYDLSVQRHPSYSVEGILVHNCTKTKNPVSKRVQAFRRTEKRAPRRWGLTGTPVPNSLLDLFAQVRLIDDGKRLGPSFDHFKNTYFAKADYMGYKWKEKPGSSDTIHERIADITLTLKSSEWLNIPDTVIEDIEVPLGPDLQKKYDKFESELVMEIRKDKQITASTAAALVSKLLQFTSGSIYDEDKEWHDIHDLKFAALRRIQKQEKSPLLVAYNFQHEAARLRKAFPEMEFFADAKTIASQTDLINRWNAGKIKMLAAHPQSVGHGLNLQHGGNVIVWLTLTYSRENYEQMIARLARRGQDEVVKVYRVMCPGTADEAVATAILEKQETENHLLDALMLLESYRRTGGPALVEKHIDTDWL